jgi:hypothetical protein
MSVSIYVHRTRLKLRFDIPWDCNGEDYHSGLATIINFFIENDPIKWLLVHNQDVQHAIQFCAISGFRHGVNEICALSRFYVALNGGLLPVLWESLSVPPLRVQQFFLDCLTVQMGPTVDPNRRS